MNQREPSAYRPRLALARMPAGQSLSQRRLQHFPMSALICSWRKVWPAARFAGRSADRPLLYGTRQPGREHKPGEQSVSLRNRVLSRDGFTWRMLWWHQPGDMNPA